MNDLHASALNKRRSDDSLRQLSLTGNLIDLCSNDYLGFARSQELKQQALNAFEKVQGQLNGSGGSRLLSGNSALAEELEAFVAAYHGAEAGLIFNSGYDANLGLLSCIASKDDTIIYDERSHASIHDGVRLSRASTFMFRHNDTEHLAERLKQAKGQAFVVVESVYSMDGDLAPLKEIARMCEKHGALLIVDEAHATGVFGNGGRGLVSQAGLGEQVFARMHTFGKALGCHGAIVLGSNTLRDYLVNFARSFIYTTALPPHSLVSIRCAYDMLSISNDKILKINKLISLFKGTSPIQSLLVPGNENAKRAAKALQEAGYDVRAVLSPTVPKGSERLRVCLHAYNTEEEVKGFLTALNSGFRN